MGARQATVRAWVLPHLLAYVANRGADAGALRQAAGLQGRDLDDPDTFVPDRAAERAWDAAVAMTGDEALGLHMAQAIPAGALDLLEYAFRSSATLGAGLDRLARYGRVLSDRAAARTVRGEEGLAVSWDAGVQRSRADFALAFVVRMAREATGRRIVPAAVRFAFHAPSADERIDYKGFFGAPLVYEAFLNQVVFATGDISRPLVTADAALAGVVGRRLEKMLGQLPRSNESASAVVRRALAQHLVRGEGTVGAVCRELGMSRRTLHRRLEAERTSFRSLLDGVRADIARALLRDRAVGVAEIAFLLGYSEPSSLHRSFKRWTGQTPRAFRRRAMGG